jgi:hypothetical protein
MRAAQFPMLVKSLCLFLLLAICAGCSQRILLLKRFASGQKEMENYVARQEKGFLRLKEDVRHNLLQKGTSIETVIKKYGEPVFCAPAEGEHPILSDKSVFRSAETPTPPAIAQSCLYRAPTEYFSADKVYLYFDRQECLHSWKYEPAE